MRLNGGVIGKSNEPTNRRAPGVWSAEEQRIRQLYGKFPRYYEGWDLTYLVNSSPNFVRSFSLDDTAPTGVTFTPSGNTMFIAGFTGDDIKQYSVTTPWNISTATFTSNYAGGSSSTLNPTGVAFRSDGRSMFVATSEALGITQHSPNIAWAFSTASTAYGKYFTTQSSLVPNGIFFKPDGLAMFISCSSGSTQVIQQYSLSQAWDIQSATYIKLFSVASQEGSLQDVAFSSDGTLMFTIGNSSDRVYQYSLSTAWDVGTASYGGTSFSVASSETNPTGLAFSSDGLYMFIVGYDSDTVRRYALGSSFNISGASASGTFSISAQENFPSGIDFSSDGTIMYIVGSSGNDINQYSLSPAWNIAAASYVGTSSALSPSVLSIRFKPDGKRAFVVGSGGGFVRVAEVAFTTAGQVSTMQNGSLPSSIIPRSEDVVFSSDGTNMYVVENALPIIRQYSLDYPWDFYSANYIANLSVAVNESTPKSLRFSNDGTTMLVVGSTSDNVLQYSLSNAWSVSSATYVQSFYVNQLEGIPQGIDLSPDGSNLYLTGDSVDSVFQISLGTPNSVRSPADDSISYSVAAQELTSAAIELSRDGKQMYIMGTTGDDVNQYTLSVPWNISSASYTANVSVADREQGPSALRFKPDGTRMFVLGTTSDRVQEYTLSAPWDITTATYTSNVSITAQEATPSGLAFKPDGTKMYVAGSSGDDVNEYTLSIPWNVTTASFVQIFSLAAQDTSPEDVVFNPDGTRMFILGSTNDRIYQYNLSSPWNVSTATFDKSLYIAHLDTTPTGLTFKDDGTRMFIVGSALDRIHQINLG
jgi:sugar lactone lactonase YvrE